MVSILHLPVELASLIVKELPDESLVQLRLVCRKTAAWTNDRFVTAFFQTRRVMLEQRSLKTLDAISQHAVFGPCIQTVEIYISHLVPHDELGGLCHVISKFDYPDPTKHKDDKCLNQEQYSKHFTHQEKLIQTGFAATCLAQVMKRPAHCNKIHVRDASDYFPWGWRQLVQEIGIRPQRTLVYQSQYSIQFVRHLLHAVFTAIARSNLQAETLQISIGNHFGLSSSINPSILTGLDLPQLVQIRHVILCLLPGYGNNYSPNNPGTWAAELAQFFQLLPSLSKLELESECFSDMDDVDWFSGFCFEAYIPNLQSLTLKMLVCTSHEMAYFLLRHRATLRHLFFDYFELSDGTPDISWHQLLQKLRGRLSSDTYLRMSGCLGESYCIHDGTGLPETLEATGTQDIDNILSLLSEPGLWE